MKAVVIVFAVAILSAPHAVMAQDAAVGTGAAGTSSDAGTSATPPSGGAREMSVEELEAFIEKRRTELEAVQKNREQTEAKAARVRQAIDERKAELRKIQSELESLCKDREKISEGSFDQCMAANGADRKPAESAAGGSADGPDDVADDG